MNEFVPSNRFTRKLIAGVSLVSAVVFALLVAGEFIRRSVNNHLERAMAEAGRDDPNWRIHDLLASRIPVPDEQNSALIVNEVAESLPENWPFTVPPKTVPKPPPTIFEEAYQRTLDLGDNERMPSDVEDIIREELDRLQDVVELARTVANYDRGRHEIVLGPTVFDTKLDETEATRRVVRLLVLDAYRLAQEGKLDEALDSCRASLSVGRSIGDEPNLISQWVRMANRSGAISVMVRVMAQGVASDLALAKVQELLTKEMDEPLFLWGIRGERASHDEMLRKLADGELSLDQIGKSYDETKVARPVSFWGKLWYNHQRAVAIEWMNELVAIPQLPTPEWQPAYAAFEKNYTTAKRASLDRYINLIPVLVMPSLNMHDLNRSHGRLRAALVLIAAERHRIKHGDWPESIDAIDPLILPKAPLDPYTNLPFRLDRPEGRYIVYSVGPNLTDEHGAYDQRNWNKSKSRDDVGATGWDVSLRGKPAP